MVSTMMTTKTTTATNKRCSSSSSNNHSNSHHKISTAELRERLRQASTSTASTTTTRRNKKIVMKKKDGSLALVNKDMGKKQERKLSIQDCLSKYDDTTTESDDDNINNIIKGRGRREDNKAALLLPSDPHRSENNNNNNNNCNKPNSVGTLGTSGSMSLQGSVIEQQLTKTLSQQQLEATSDSTHAATTSFERRCNTSLDLSLDLSSHRRSSSSSTATTGHGGTGGDAGDIISTAASEEQWARFKLLGRTGFGEIDVSSNKALQLLIDRNFDILKRALKNIVAIRDDSISDHNEGDGSGDDIDDIDVDDNENTNNKPFSVRNMNIKTGHLLDEVRETIDFSTTTTLASKSSKRRRDPDTITLKTQVEEQLRDYITVISAMYRNNPFHNFEHASTVLSNVNKLMGLVVKRPDDGDGDDVGDNMSDDIDIEDITKYGCGVTNDPLIQFALVFSALVHDVDHAGVSNAQLIKEKSLVAGAYKNRSVAEQNSIELAWQLLLEPCYKEFRETIFMTPVECSRFRGLVVTAVMATDIADKELAKLRKDRAAEVLDTNNNNNNNDSDNADDDDPDEVAAMKKSKLISRKATYVVETIIQAADISHTMQSFGMYKKWNQKLFREMYDAYKSGRAEKDPSTFWYNGEFGFFDFYIVPLCNKLKDCGIFEKASEDYINNAKNNRKAWEELGENLVAGYLKEYDNAKGQQPQTKLKKKRIKKKTIGDETSSEEDEEDVLELEETVNIKPADNHRHASCDSSTESPLDTDFESFGDNSDDESLTPGLDNEVERVVSHTPKKIMRGNKADGSKSNHRHAISREEPSQTTKKMNATTPQAKAKRVRKKSVEPSPGGGRKKERSKSFQKDAMSVGDGSILTGKVRRVRSKSADPTTLKRRSRSKSVDKTSVTDKAVRRGSCGSVASSGAEKERRKGKKVRRGSCSSGGSSGCEKELKKGKKVPSATRGREVKKVTDRGRKVVRSKSRDAASVGSKVCSTPTRKTTTQKQRSRSNEVELKSRNETTSKLTDTDSVASAGINSGKKIRRRSKSLEPSDLTADNKKKERRGCKKPKPKIKKMARVAAVQ